MKRNFTLNKSLSFPQIKQTIVTATLLFSTILSAQNHPLDVKGLEDISKRDIFSRHFQTDNGMTAVISSSPINYAKQGGYGAINTSIIAESDPEYPQANTENLMETHFGATAHSGILSVTKEAVIKEFINNKMYWESNQQQINRVDAANVMLSIDNNKALYPQIFDGVTAEFVILNGKRKLNYRINSSSFLQNAPSTADYLVFSEDIILPNYWSYRVSDAGIYLIDGKNNEVYLYEKPYSTDAATKSPRSTNTIMTVSKNGNILTIATKVKSEWILNPARVFPVVIDPTATIYPNQTTFQTGSVYSSDGYKVDGVIAFGRDADFASAPDFLRGWARFNTTSIPDDSNIDAGTTVHFFIEEGSADYSPQYGHSLVLSQIPANLNPATASGNSLYNAIEVAGYSPVLTSAINTIGWKSHTLTSTQIALDIKAQLAQNIFSVGFMPQGNFYPEEYLVASGWDSTEKPYLVINYSAPLSVANYTKNIGIYPNPASHILSVDTTDEVATLEIYSMLGQKVASTKAQKNIAVSNLSAGMYTVKITLISGTASVQKFIKQ